MSFARHPIPLALALSLGASVWLAPETSSAFCRTRTCDPTDMVCAEDANGCITSGEFLRWTSSCVSFSVQQDASAKRNISFTLADNIIGGALNKWMDVKCGASARPSLEVANFGPSSCRVPAYNSKGPNANVWMFADAAWKHMSDAHTLALTTVRYDPTTGEIFDADVEVNSALSVITTSDDNVVADLESIATHEAGHFLGLSHSSDQDATMWAGYQPRNTRMRDLAADDIAAICEAYPAGRPIGAATCEPRRGFTKLCSEDLSESGCAVAKGATAPRGTESASGSGSGTSPLTASIVALFGATLAFWTRRRRAVRY